MEIARDQGATHFLAKPFSAQDLGDKINAFINNSEMSQPDKGFAVVRLSTRDPIYQGDKFTLGMYIELGESLL